jgi:hypothetical protein
MATTLSIRVEDDQKVALASRAAECGYASVEAYVEALVQAEAGRIEYGGPGHLRPATRQQLESLIRKGAASPAREMGNGDWQDIRRRLIERHRQPKAG